MSVTNRTLFIADNLNILRGINSDCIDLIYLDPPFNSKKQYKAPMGSPAEGASFKDIWTDEDIKYGWHGEIAEHNEELYQIIQASEVVYDKSMKIYLMAMAVRLFEMKRILKSTGSIYLHCDPTASHYLKMVMDALFGKQNFRNEIVWCYGGRGMSKTRFNRKHDIILFYGKTQNTFFSPEGASRPVAAEHVGRYNKMDDQGRKYARIKNRDGTYSDIYLSDVVREDWWEVPFVRGKERTGWPTQKPLALLERIIKASSNEGDVVLDPFCGCATACVAAEQLQRQWIGIDISPSAEVITKIRLQDEVDKQTNLWKPLEDIIVRTDSPQRTDISDETASQMRLPKAHIHKHQLYGEQEGKCAGCHYFLPFRNMTIDHIVPKSKGGTDVTGNLQLLCNACNSTKNTRSQSEFIAILREQGIRTDGNPLGTENRSKSKSGIV